MTLTKNTDKLRQEVAAHVAADSIVQGIYWDAVRKQGCFFGCLAKSNDPTINEDTYGLPVMVQRIAESIFEALPANEAKAFFAALPDAVDADGKDLTRVSWQFLAAELRNLPEQSAEIQAGIDPVIAGMDLLASGQEWPDDAARTARTAAETAARVAARTAAWAAVEAAEAAVNAAWAAVEVAEAAANAAVEAAVDAVDAAEAAANAAWAATRAATRAVARATTDVARATARLRQRDLLLRLIAEAPVVENTNDH